MRRRLEIGLAVLSLAAATAHVALEWRFHVRFGQFLPNLWIHGFAAVWMAIAGFRVLRGPGAVGPLCGAWGLTAGLVALSFTAIAQRLLENRVSASHIPGIQILAVAVIVAAVGLALSIGLAWARRDRDGPDSDRTPGR